MCAGARSHPARNDVGLSKLRAMQLSQNRPTYAQMGQKIGGHDQPIQLLIAEELGEGNDGIRYDDQAHSQHIGPFQPSRQLHSASRGQDQARDK